MKRNYPNYIVVCRFLFIILQLLEGKKTLINQKPVEGDIKNSNDDYLINSFLSISKVQYFIIQELSPDNESH